MTATTAAAAKKFQEVAIVIRGRKTEGKNEGWQPALLFGEAKPLTRSFLTIEYLSTFLKLLLLYSSRANFIDHNIIALFFSPSLSLSLFL